MVLDVLISTRRQEKIRYDCQRVFETNHGYDTVDCIGSIAVMSNSATPGLPVQHQLPETTHTHVH